MDENLIINPDVKEPDKINIHKDLAHYRKTLSYMGSNVPIGVLCLPKALENSLTKQGILRVYDLIDRDLAKIEGIGSARLGLLTSRLDEFFTVGI
jgi:hypothetical protein